MNNPNEKQEIIEQALQEAVGGGMGNICSWNCHFFSKDICHIEFCGSQEN